MPPTSRVALLTLPLVLVALASAAPGVPGAPGVPVAASPPVFGAPVQLPASANFAEPSLAVSPVDGTVYVAAPGGSTVTWRSADGAASWQRTASTPGRSGDSDIAVDSTGVVYGSDLFDNAPVSVSSNKADSFQFSTKTADTNNLDREWVASCGANTVFSTWRDGNLNERFDKSTDGGRTFSAPITVVSNVDKRGNIYCTSATDLYIPYTDATREDVHIAVSHDGGATWATHDVATTSGGDPCIFPTVAKDQAGVLYVTWCDIGSYGQLFTNARVSLAVSRDGGATWGAPIRLSDDAKYNAFPWMLADARGHVQVAWYEGQLVLGLPTIYGDPNAAAAVQWSVRVASSGDADAASPTFSLVKATGVVHTGPICTHGGACFPFPNPVYGNRAFLDFFEMGELPSGKSVIVFPQDSTLLGLSGGTNLFTVTQSGGDLLK